MARYESSEPVEIMDRLLWRDAQQMLDRHAEPGPDGRCEWCGWHWPCPPRRLAERAEVASRRPWRESWTARHDLNDLRTLPSALSGAGANRWSGPGRWAGGAEAPDLADWRADRNGGLFD